MHTRSRRPRSRPPARHQSARFIQPRAPALLSGPPLSVPARMAQAPRLQAPVPPISGARVPARSNPPGGGGCTFGGPYLLPSKALEFPFWVYTARVWVRELKFWPSSSAGDHDEGIAAMDFQLSAAKLPEGCWSRHRRFDADPRDRVGPKRSRSRRNIS